MSGRPAAESVLVISGTGTGIGKTVTTAAIAALAAGRGGRVAVVKPAQTGVAPGDPGDCGDVRRLTGAVTARELTRYPDPLAPATAARRAGAPPVTLDQVTAAVKPLAAAHDLVLIEGAGGLLTWFDDDGMTLADVASALAAPVLLVTGAALGTLNATALAAEALARRRIACPGLVIGRWPAEPDLAARCNVTDLPRVSGLPLLGALPESMGGLARPEFHAAARAGLAPALGGEFDPGAFTAATAAPPP